MQLHAPKPLAERLVVVDEQDEPIGDYERGNRQPNDPVGMTRMTVLWLTNSNNQVLLAQRSFKKIGGPGLWAFSAGGAVASNETYESNIHKEAEEEIGLTNAPLAPVIKLDLRHHNMNVFCQLYTGQVDHPIEYFVRQESEVEAIRWVDQDWFLNDLNQHPKKYSKYMKDFMQYVVKP